MEKKTLTVKLDLPQDILNFNELFVKNNQKLYVVGGAVRDHILGQKPNDFDLVTNATPNKTMDILKDYRCDLQGVHFGIVRVFTDDCPSGYEIASYRKDISKGRDTKGDDKKVDIGNHITIKDDIRRRDLTINSLFYNIENEEIIDIVGGIDDINNKIVKTVGDPIKRFNEDRLRIIRLVRYAAITNSRIDRNTDIALKSDSRLFNISDVDDVSRERIFAEFNKVKEKARVNDDPYIIKRFVDLLIEYDILEQIFPVLTKHKTIKPTKYLTVAIAQVLRDNRITPNFKQILIDAKIPIRFVDTISILIKINRNGINPLDVYELDKLMKSKGVRKDIIEDWINVMNITDKSIIKFIEYSPITTGHDVISDGFKGIEIGNEIRRREADRYTKMIKES